MFYSWKIWDMNKTAHQLYEPRREKTFFFGVHAPDSPDCAHVDTETTTNLLILEWESLEIFQSVQENFQSV